LKKGDLGDLRTSKRKEFMAETIYWQNVKMGGIAPQKRGAAQDPAGAKPDGIASMIVLG
jgi:hypothetical protein